MTDPQPPRKVSDSLVGQAVMALPDEIRVAAVREWRAWLDGLRGLAPTVAMKCMAGEALLRADARDPTAGLYKAAAHTAELNAAIQQLESQFDTTTEGDPK